MNLWIPDRAGHDAVGALPEGVSLSLIPAAGELPDAILQAEFLVPGAGDQRLPGLLGKMPALKVIQTLSAGIERLLPFIPDGVTLCDARGTRDVPVSEWVLAAILASTKNFGELRDRQRERRWQWRTSGELAGSTVMILGYGAIGVAVESRLVPFGVDLIRVARRARAGVHPTEELRSLLPRAAIVIVLLPLTPATTGLLDADLLGRMRPGALLVNAARGAIVDTAALLELVQAGRLRAALDVTEPEPLPADHPLWDAAGVLITPHLAGDSAAAEHRAFSLVGEQVRRFVTAQPLTNVVRHGY